MNAVWALWTGAVEVSKKPGICKMILDNDQAKYSIDGSENRIKDRDEN